MSNDLRHQYIVCPETRAISFTLNDIARFVNTSDLENSDEMVAKGPIGAGRFSYNQNTVRSGRR